MTVLLDGEHASAVDAWLKRSAKDQPAKVLLQLFEAAFSALWSRTDVTLGEVTLTAIADRVLYGAAEKFPLLASLKLEPTGGIDGSELAARLGSVASAELKEGLRFVLVEFLTVLGNLTAGILTPELHAELAGVTGPKPKRADQAQRGPGELAIAAGKD